METLQEYWIYKNRVEAKTTGANIHQVNNLLGLIINSIERLVRHNESRMKGPLWRQWDIEDRERIERTTKEIARITGVHP